MSLFFRNFAKRFHEEITKRYTSVLVDRNVGTFYSEKQERYGGSRVLRGLYPISAFQGISDNLYPKKWCVRYHALYIVISMWYDRQQKK